MVNCLLQSSHQKLVKYWARKYQSPRFPAEELESAGTLAVLRAVKNYKGDGSGINQYVGRCIRNAVIDELRFLRQSRKRCTTEVLDSDPVIETETGYGELYDAIDKLNKPCREFCLNWMQYGCSAMSAGKALGLTTQQRNIRWRLVREQLQKEMSTYTD